LNYLYVHGVGILGPGLPGWAAARRVMCREQPYRYELAPEPRPDALPPNERRRGARTVRWAIAVAEEAMRDSGIPSANVASVFATSSGDGETLHQICEALARPEREMSPTRFHNSVHNAAAGYWSIASGSRRTSMTLCGHDASFGVGLLEASSLVQAGEDAVLLVVYDLPYPEPLRTARPIRAPLAVAILLSGEARPWTLAKWKVSLTAEAAINDPAQDWPAELASNPAAQALPLLATIARRAFDTTHVALGSRQRLVIDSLP
jgi:beta-ketoacyl synthase-like protein